MKKLSVLDTYAKRHMIFFVLALLSVISIIPAVFITWFWIIFAILIIFTLIFLVINIVDTIKVFRIIFPTVPQITITWFMYAGLGLLTIFAGFYVNSLIKIWKNQIAELDNLENSAEEQKYFNDAKEIDNKNLIPEDKMIVDMKQFKSERKFKKTVRKRKMILSLIIILLIIASAFIYNYWSQSFLKIVYSPGAVISGSVIKNDSNIGFKNVKIKILLYNNTTFQTTIDYIGPRQKQSLRAPNYVKSDIYNIYIFGWNVITIVVLLSLPIIILVSALVYFLMKNSLKNVLQVIESSIISTNSNKDIKGVIVNSSTREFSNIKLRFAVYDLENNQIGTMEVVIANIQPFRRAIFRENISEKLIELNASSVELIKISKA